ncbi:MAG: prolipoprotein diacylglyceryl transferase [Rivihabitans pingtungensis]|uniref:prolipoprotein diacylglyceryl transferase n=1 Tax=Rivihabitans pingtungensis TaxID=1054498 RepID=UPI00235728D6|nr:prolipoprotein diacylglyceryl transferase [Rivihabitans pingtungensis]MCK6436043.1 prolipoprotein diacylglyceryl transferase [Rivihabitans pingtungensis]HNX71327.1 prolipoprotein diacylglyceryl transferase [Rivihabitans pingtungensis]
MLIHPQFDPIAVSLGPLAVRWYGLMYLLGFVLFMLLGQRRLAQSRGVFTAKMLDDLLFYGVLGVILGGRLGYVLFYKLGDYLADPLAILRVWEGGMAFHGGFLGVVVAMALFARRHGLHFLQVTDFIAPLVPLGLAAGRIGNFINGELWGRVTRPDAPWAMVFPQASAEDTRQALMAPTPEWLTWLASYGGLPRHPSQLYQFALEGVMLFVLLWGFSARPRPLGQVSALFLLGYGVARFVAEFAREPDNFLGLLALNLSMGQWLSLPMMLAGAWLWQRAARQG